MGLPHPGMSPCQHDPKAAAWEGHHLLSKLQANARDIIFGFSGKDSQRVPDTLTIRECGADRAANARGARVPESF